MYYYVDCTNLDTIGIDVMIIIWQLEKNQKKTITWGHHGLEWNVVTKDENHLGIGRDIHSPR